MFKKKVDDESNVVRKLSKQFEEVAKETKTHGKGESTEKEKPAEGKIDYNAYYHWYFRRSDSDEVRVLLEETALKMKDVLEKDEQKYLGYIAYVQHGKWCAIRFIT